MRKVTEKIRQAFYNQESLTVSNTTTDGQAVWLHGNKIIERRPDGIWFTLAGWDTNTTRERLNGIVSGVNISRCKGVSYLTSSNRSARIDPHKWINLNQFNQGV